MNACLNVKREEMLSEFSGGFGNGVKHVSKSSLRLHHIPRLIRICYLCSSDRINH